LGYPLSVINKKTLLWNKLLVKKLIIVPRVCSSSMLRVSWCVFCSMSLLFHLMCTRVPFIPWYLCGSAFEPGASGLPYYCTSICARSCCTWRATCVDSKPPNKNVFFIHVPCFLMCFPRLFYFCFIGLHVYVFAIHPMVHCGSALEPGLPYYCTSTCVRSWCNWRASCIHTN